MVVLDGVHWLRAREPGEDSGIQSGHVGDRAGTDPDHVVAEQVLVDQNAIDLRKRKRCNGARRETGRLLHLGAARDARLDGVSRPCDLVEIDTSVSGDEHDDGLAVTDEHERLHDLRKRATGCAGGVLGGRGAGLELLEPCLDASLTKIGGDPFHGLRPARAHVTRVPVGAATESGRWPLSFLTRRENEGDEVTTQEAEKIARTEALFRDVNERIAETAERFEADETKFVCECADPSCTTRIDATLEHYESVREDGATFLLVPGHEDERVEAVVTMEEDHAVVEKRHPEVAPLVLARDPRGA